MDHNYNYQHIVNSTFTFIICVVIKLTLQQRQWLRCLEDWETEFLAVSPFLGVKYFFRKYQNIKILDWGGWSPVSTMKGLTSIRWPRLPGWVCNTTINDQWNWSVKYCHIFACKILPGMITFIFWSFNVLMNFVENCRICKQKT